MIPADQPWAVALFRRSVLKQRKLAQIEACLDTTEGRRCLDLGSDNGVVSYLLRRRGGRWASGDLTEQSVASIRGLVGTDVHRVEGHELPFENAEFDVVVVVDMLEHVADDRAFVGELARVTKAGGALVVNTPHLKRSPGRKSPQPSGVQIAIWPSFSRVPLPRQICPVDVPGETVKVRMRSSAAPTDRGITPALLARSVPP